MQVSYAAKEAGFDNCGYANASLWMPDGFDPAKSLGWLGAVLWQPFEVKQTLLYQQILKIKGVYFSITCVYGGGCQKVLDSTKEPLKYKLSSNNTRFIRGGDKW